MIYDGDCVFCTRGVKTINRLDGGKRFAFISLHDPAVAGHCPELAYDRLMEQMFIATADGRTFGGAAALRYLTRRLPLLWIFAPLLHIPFSLPLWQRSYLFVARQRYRLLGKTDSCDGGTCDLHGE